MVLSLGELRVPGFADRPQSAFDGTQADVEPCGDLGILVALEFEQGDVPEAVVGKSGERSREVIVERGKEGRVRGPLRQVAEVAQAVAATVVLVTRNDDGTWSWSFLTSDGFADTQTVTITAIDSDGDAAITTFDLFVNVPPDADPDTGNRDAGIRLRGRRRRWT